MWDPNEETALIDHIDFGLFDPEELTKLSVAQITKPSLFEHGNTPAEGGLSDPRLGTISSDYNCTTCGKDHFTCPGHFGHIRFVRPLYHIGYIDIVYKILQCVCSKCGRLLASYSQPELQSAVTHYHGRNRFLKVYEIIHGRKAGCEHKKTKEMIKQQKAAQDQGAPAPAENAALADAAKNAEFWRRVSNTLDESQWVRKSQPCGSKQNELEKNAQGRISRKDVRGESGIITAEVAYEILRQITDQDIRILGFDPIRCHPKWMILKVLPVPPLHVRPAVAMDGVHKSQDDVTKKLSTIIMCNNSLENNINNGSANTVITEDLDTLQLHVTTYMVNDKPSIQRATMKNGRPFKAISQRLKGKSGHIRGHLSGKRVNFSSRSVISPDPSISIDQVGVPQEIARILTFPEVVTARNLTEMQRLVYNGNEAQEGANYVITPQGTRINLAVTQESTAMQLDHDSIVERHLRDDDIVIFNRQPSLHKMSMMGHRARIMPGQTFRLNLCVTTPYNADFDGDEMNMHVPQSQMARAEAKHIMLVPNQIISPQSACPIIGLVQDSLLGCRLLSLRDTFLTRNEITNLMMWIIDSNDIVLPPPCILKPKELWSGKQVFSLFLPKINYDGFSVGADAKENTKEVNTWESPADLRVIIRNGNLLAGILDKKTVAKSAGSLNHVVINSYSIETARQFLNQTQLIVNNWLENRGFSIGLSDCLAYEKTLDDVSDQIHQLKRNVLDIIDQAKHGKLETPPGLTFMEGFESKINKLLNDLINDTGATVQKASRFWNSLMQMVAAGSKGSLINISQIIAVVGQQNVEGKRIRYGFKGRTLPHYVKDDYDLECRGFCEHSFIQGLTPQEFFFHAMGGRVGIIDTACKTSDTGYIQRRLCKSMESHCVMYDGTVRNSLNEIVQFIYGGDGLEPTKLETQKCPLIELSDRVFDERFVMEINDPTFGVGKIQRDIIENLRSDVRSQERLQAETKRLRDFRDLMRTEIFPNGDSVITLSMKVQRLIDTSKTVHDINEHTNISNLHPYFVIDEVDKLAKRLVVVPGDDPIGREAQDNATLLMRIQLYTMLASKPLILKERLSMDAFKWIIGEIEERFPETIVAPGEMVGTVAGQSIGEPSTQMTLNTFHFAGVSAMDVTLGVPRLNEVMNIARHIKTPQVQIILDDEYATNSALANLEQQNLEYASLQKVVRSSEIFYDPKPHVESTVPEDREWVKLNIEAEENPDDFVSRLSPWVLRLQLDQQTMAGKNLTTAEIADTINHDYGNTVLVMFPGAGSVDENILRIHYKNEDGTKKDSKAQDQMTLLRTLEEQLFHEVHLRGVPNIKRVVIKGEKVKAIDQSSNGYSTSEKHILYTEGTAFRDILNFPHVNQQMTKTNDIMEIEEVLGIEGAREALTLELAYIYNNVSPINHRHLMLLADTMTHYGELRPVSRHGINKAPTGPLMRASYEKTVDVFFDAAAFGEVDKMSDVSSNIIVGKPSRVGTGIVDVLVDMNNLPIQMFQSTGVGLSLDRPLEVTPSPNIISPVGTTSYLGADGSATTVATMASPSILSPISGGDYEASPGDLASPLYDLASPMGNYITTAPSPLVSGSVTSPYYNQPASPIYSPFASASPNAYNATSPLYNQPMSPAYEGASPASPSYSPASPSYSPASPTYSPTSPTYSPTSPTYSPTSPTYSPSSPTYSPSSPTYSPSSPTYSPQSPASPSYSPISPSYGASPNVFSPSYSPNGAGYSPQQQGPSSYNP